MKVGDRIVEVVSEAEVLRINPARIRSNDLVRLFHDRLLARKFDLQLPVEIEMYAYATGREYKFTQTVTEDHWLIREQQKQAKLDAQMEQQQECDEADQLFEDYFGRSRTRDNLMRLADRSLKDMNCSLNS